MLIALLSLALLGTSQGIHYENIAPTLGVASMLDSLRTYSGAAKAIDGNTYGRWTNSNANTITHSRSAGTNVWWQVDFPQLEYIDNIVIWNRMDCCQDRLDKTRVLVDDKEVGEVAYKSGQRSYEIAVGYKGKVVKLWNAGSSTMNIAEVEVFGQGTPVKCVNHSGVEYAGGETYKDSEGKTCTCGGNGILCLCEGAPVSCPKGQEAWTDQETCETSCIPGTGYCSSSGDPHYTSFDGKRYDFHGSCTYQAASCSDFKVNFKNVDLLNRAPRYTLRAELEFKGVTYAVTRDYKALVNGDPVQVPYVKSFTNGDRVMMLNNGQLEIVLHQPGKGRFPAVRVRATNARNYIQAQVYLHGSCAQITEGLCGNWNGNPDDDLPGGPNTVGDMFAKYDENCPAPPAPYHPCDALGEDSKAKARSACDTLKSPPFTACHNTVSYGDEDGGTYQNCLTDVCECLLDHSPGNSCACNQLDEYASACIGKGIDLANWRQSVSFCPYECPEGLTYQAAASTPAPTCLEQETETEGTARGCFCPSGQFLQDGVCVQADQCKCLYEGSFFQPGDEIKKDSECKTCSCAAAGQMNCIPLECPELDCGSGSILASKDDACCPYCESNWVEAVSGNQIVWAGHTAEFTCAVHVAGVKKEQIIWSKDGAPVKGAVSSDGRILKITTSASCDGGNYKCTADKDGVEASADFNLVVKEKWVCTAVSGGRNAVTVLIN